MVALPFPGHLGLWRRNL